MLRKEDPKLAKEVKKVHFIFEDVVLLPDPVLRDLLRGIEPADIAMALKGQPQKVKDKFMKNIPERTQIILEDEMKLVEAPQPRRKVEEAQHKIVEKARKMEEEGRFSMSDILESDMIE
jgi:flagellar motor switch protein FliG